MIFVGLVLLLGGLLLKPLTESAIPLIMIMTGGTLKLIYVMISFLNKTYRPGKELLLLLMGLTVFFTGVYLKRQGFEGWLVIEASGILMKVTFVLLFIKKLRAVRVML